MRGGSYPAYAVQGRLAAFHASKPPVRLATFWKPACRRMLRRWSSGSRPCSEPPGASHDSAPPRARLQFFKRDRDMDSSMASPVRSPSHPAAREHKIEFPA